MKRYWRLILSLPFLALSTFSCAQTYEARLAQLYRNTVPTIRPDSLQSLIEKDSVTLLDTRQAEEYQVSHIAGAAFIDYDGFDPQMVLGLDTTRPVVVYCSVGYRSERIGETLQELGFEKVYNLYGGIFQWKNEGHQVVDSEGLPTEKVHTYNKRWGKWLQNGEKVY